MKNSRKYLAGILGFSVLIVTILSGITINRKNVKAEAISITGGASKEEATEVGTDQEYMENIATSGDVDWYHFTAPSEDSYIYLYAKDLDTDSHSYGTTLQVDLISSFGESVKSMDLTTYNSGWEKTMTYKLTANNEYYISIGYDRNLTGKYKFSLKYEEDADGNDMNSATAIDIDRLYRKTLAANSDQDWFTFEVMESGQYEITVKNNNISRKDILGADDKIFTVSILTEYSETLLNLVVDSGEEKTQQILLDSGMKHYMKCFHPSGERSGNYSFQITSEMNITPTPDVTEIATQTPEQVATSEPVETEVPTDTPEEEITLAPEQTLAPENTPAPEQTLAPDSTSTPELYDTPWPVQEATLTPDDTPAPTQYVTVAPDATKRPEAEETPGASPSQRPGTPTSTPTSTSQVVNNSTLDDDDDDDFEYVRSVSPGKVKKLKVKGKKKAVTVSWKKASHAMGYKIYISDMPNFGRYRVKNTKSTSVTFKGLRRKRYYYVKVRAYRIKSGYKEHGDWSKVKPVKTK